MEPVALLGIDLGKHTFHVHAQSKAGHQLWRKKLNRAQLIQTVANTPICRVVMESCAGAHFLARKFAQFGHDVRLIAPQYVKPFVKGNKNDFVDAEAICEAASRPTMRFAPAKNEHQQTVSALHRTREMLIRNRGSAHNQIHAYLVEFGIAISRGPAAIRKLPAVLEANALPPRLIVLLEQLRDHVLYLNEQIQMIERALKALLAEDEAAQRLLTIPGIGPITASVLSTQAGDAKQYRTSREFAASLGLVPRQYSTGGKSTLLGISKRGDKHLRTLLVQCARSIMMHIDKRTDAMALWVRQLLQRRHSSVVACALASKLARIAWAVLCSKTAYVPHPQRVVQ
ncbi:IS110 family transposase [Andreprevotia chitinilytica]|uniref:IS110 family transposase n=1 Tax=Andreprevotia chitinilytica TaxID=396808 RepID=UPI000558AD74|nr:IS110 family transposase [Andreprevotia chitinilytica]